MKNIAVIGAGIGGLSVAIALKQRNFAVEIFEKRQIVEGLGAGLTLWPNATRVLRELGVLDLALTDCGFLKNLFVQTSQGRPLMKIPVENFDTPSFAMHRGNLHKILLSQLEGTNIRTQQLVEKIDLLNNESFLWANGQKYGPYDLIIGADGLYSQVREFVNPEMKLKHQGYVIWRGIAEMPGPIAEEGAFYETWGRGHRFGILPLGKNHICWYATANESYSRTENAESEKQKIKNIFHSWIKPIPEIIERTPDQQIVYSDTFELTGKKIWYKDAVVLLGDAIHPISANLGQGSCLAMEDALVLSKCLAQEKNRGQALNLYQKLRSSRANSIRKRAKFVGDLGQWQNAWSAPLRNSFTQLIPGRWFTLTSRSIHSYQADKVI